MSTGVNPSTTAGISIGSALSGVADWLRQITIRVIGAHHAQGSGVIWCAEGLIVTNAHVADSQVQQIELPNGRRLPAWLLARDREHDLAALAVSSSGLPVPSIRSARTLRVGEVLLAVGNPWDGLRAVSTGIVHESVGNTQWLMADIRLAPGNSGGPLADAEGNVVGINSMIIGGFGCAVTSDAIEGFLRKVHLAEAV